MERKWRPKLQSVDADFLTPCETCKTSKSRRLSLPTDLHKWSTNCYCVRCCSCSPTKRSTNHAQSGYLNKLAFDLNNGYNLIWCKTSKSIKYHTFPTHTVVKRLPLIICQKCGKESETSLLRKFEESNSLFLCNACTWLKTVQDKNVKNFGDTSNQLTCEVETISAVGENSVSQLQEKSREGAVNLFQPPPGKVASDIKHKSQEMLQYFGELNDEQKNIMLEKLLHLCATPQTHRICELLQVGPHPDCPENCMDRLCWLPEHLAVHILSYLDPVSLARCSQVCKAWCSLSNTPLLWRHLSSFTKWRMSRGREEKQMAQCTSPLGDIQWKKVFAERFRLRQNWLRGKCTVRTFEGHQQGVSCIQFDDTRIISGSSDKTIKVWNIRTNSPWSVQTLVGHYGTVRCLHLVENQLVSGSTDKTIKVWDLSTQLSWSSIACKVTMIGHTDTVRCIQMDDNKVISGSHDTTLKIWDVKTGACKRTLRGHSEAVLCVRFNSKKIVSGSVDKTIKVWDFEGHSLMTLEGHRDAVTCLEFDSHRIISGSIDCTLRFWDIQSGSCHTTIDWKVSEGHKGVIRCLQADSWRVVSGSDDRTIKVWNLETGQRLVTFRNHTDGVTCLQFNDAQIVSGSYDQTVKLWDFSSV